MKNRRGRSRFRLLSWCVALSGVALIVWNGWDGRAQTPEHSSPQAPQHAPGDPAPARTQRRFTGTHHTPRLPDSPTPHTRSSDTTVAASGRPDTSAAETTTTTRELERQISELKRRATSYYNLAPTERKRYAALVNAWSARQSQQPAAERFADIAHVFRGDPATSSATGGAR